MKEELKNSFLNFLKDNKNETVHNPKPIKKPITEEKKEDLLSQ